MSKYVFGLDVGGMSIKFGLFQDGKLIEKFSVKTSTEDGGKNILPDAIKEIKNIMEEHQIDREDVLGIGIGVPGAIVNQAIAKQAVNLGWGEVNVKQTIEEALGIKTLVANDANVASLGEMWKGDTQGSENIVFITLGTGVGGGIIIDGKILEGTLGSGGEIGHFPIVDEDLAWTCGCGNRRCVEQICSASGIVNIAKHKIETTDTPSQLRSMENFEAKDVIDLARVEDELASEVIETVSYYTGKLMATLAAIINPDYFIIGGGVANAGDFLIDKYEREFRKLVFKGANNAKVIKAKLGNDAGIYGACKLILG